MRFSAARSRSMVLMPDRTIARSSSSTWRTTWPLRRNLSISLGALQTIAIPLDCLHHRRGHLLDRLLTVNFHQLAGLRVTLLERRRLPLIRLQALDDDVFRVIMPHHKLRAVPVAKAGDTRRLVIDVVDAPAGGTLAA